MAGKKDKERSALSSPTKDDSTAPVRKSTRLKQNSKFEERMSMFIMQTKRGSDSDDDSSDEEDKVEIKRRKEEPKKTVEKSKDEEDTKSDSDEDKSEVDEEEETAKKNVGRTKDDSDVEEDDDPPKKKRKKPSEKLSKNGRKIGRPKKKVPTPEPSDSEEGNNGDNDVKDQDFNPGMLNLRRVGDALPAKKGVSLNARGMPQRIRKKNKLFYDDNIVNIPGKKDKSKKLTATEKKLQRKFKDKKEEEIKQMSLQFQDSTEANVMRQRVGMKLRNLLKLPKAQRWVFFEFFYSNIDHVLFHGTNDFVLCLDETFGHLRTMKMTRVEWSVLRRLMGKPRRCSQSFFREERATLERRRDVIRLIQQRKIKDASQIKDLPDKIPLQLSVNACVTAKLRFPQTGLFTGKVDAVDPSNNTYRITFDRPNLGTHSIPDYEVMLSGEPDMVSIVAMQKRYQSARHSQPPKPRQQQYLWNDAKDPKQIWMENMKQATFPLKFYETMIRICKILREKKQIVESLNAMNTEAEKMVLWEDPYPLFFQKRYAELLINLECLNLSLNRRLNVVQKYCHDIVPDICESVMLAPTYVREKNIADAKATMKSFFTHKEPLKSQNTTLLVVELMALVLQLQNLTRPKPSSQDRFVLKQTLQRVKSMISPENLLLFQNSVEVHVKYIETRFSDNNHLSSLLVAPSKASDEKSEK